MDDETKRRFVSWNADMDIRYGRVFSIVDIQESNMEIWENVLLIIKESSLCREKSDYDDFYIAGKAEAEEQFKNAKYFVQKIEEYVEAME